MMGIASVELPTRVEGLKRNNSIMLAVSLGTTTVCKTDLYNSDNNKNITMSVTLPDRYQESCRLYVMNTDPSDWDDGCHVYFPNGFKLNKRQYRFMISPPDAVSFRGGDEVKVGIQNDSDDFLLYWGDSSTVSIAYNNNGLPVKLVGYQLQSSSGQRSATIPLSGSSFTFNRAFLKAYESTYCYNTSKDGKSYATFVVAPVFEKIKTSVVLENSSYGSIYIKDYNGEQLYMGDKIVIGGRPNDGTSFYGVYYKCYKGNSESISLSGTQDMASTGYVTYTIGQYDKVVLQGAFNIDADRLMVNYAVEDAENRHGKLKFEDGVVLEKEKYVKNDYFPLMADPDNGYITQWCANGNYFYGDIFYYQLDGNPNNNWITVEFVKESSLDMQTGTISGTLSVNDMELRTSSSTAMALSEKDYSVYANGDAVYTGKTDANGKYTIQNFKGVVGGKYSIAVTRDNAISYATFVPFASKGVAQQTDVNSGYEFINAIEDNAVTLEQSIPDLPGAQNAYNTNAADLAVPLLGSADFSLTSLTGGYFVQKTINGTTYLICGYSITPSYGRGLLQDKYNAAKQTATALKTAQEKEQMLGSASVQSNVLGESTNKTAGQTGAQTQKKKASNFSIYPAFMFKFALTTGADADGEPTTVLTGFEMALGFDVYYLKNIPYTIYGFPFYLCVTTQVEAYAQLQHTMEPNTKQGSDTTMTLYEMCQDPDKVDEATVTDSGFFSAPTLSVGLKAGAGFNGFLSAYVSGTVSLPMTFQFAPVLDVGGEFGFSISFGADLVFFTANYTPLNASAEFGSEELREELSTIQGYSTSFKSLSAAQKGTSTLATGEEMPTLEEMMNSLTFSLMERPDNGTNLLRSVSVDSATREQMVSILYRFAELMGYDTGARSPLSQFEDEKQISKYATDSMSWAVAEHLIYGFTDGTVCPAGTATRGQLAALLRRFRETFES